MTKVLVTGGAGFIGSHLIDALPAARGLDNFLTGGQRERVTEGDIVFYSDLINTIMMSSRPDVIIHCAASYSAPDNWERDVSTNVLGTINVIRLCQELNARLIYFQTSLCYGLDPVRPIPIDWPLDPQGSYAISKTAAERYIAQSGVDFVSFRLANIYGPRNLSGPIPTFYKRLAASQSCYVADTRRDFIYIDDLVKLVLKAVEGQGRGFYNVGSGRDYTIQDVFETMTHIMNVTPEVEYRERGPDDTYSILLNVSKTRLEFGWSPKVELAAGLEAAIEWYEANDVGETYTHLRMGE